MRGKMFEEVGEWGKEGWVRRWGKVVVWGGSVVFRIKIFGMGIIEGGLGVEDDSMGI